MTKKLFASKKTKKKMELRATMLEPSHLPVSVVLKRATSNFKSYAAHTLNIDYCKCGAEVQILSLVTTENTCKYYVVGCAYGITKGQKFVVTDPLYSETF